MLRLEFPVYKEKLSDGVCSSFTTSPPGLSARLPKIGQLDKFELGSICHIEPGLKCYFKPGLIELKCFVVLMNITQTYVN